MSDDDFGALLRGDDAGSPSRADPAATERFGWGAAVAQPTARPAADPQPQGYPQPYGGQPGQHQPGRTGAQQPGYSGNPGHAAHPGYGGYTTAVEPVPETVLARTRPHARRLTLPVLILFATVTAFGWYGGRFAEEWQNWTALGVAIALVFFGTLLPFFAWLGHRYTITTRRVIARRGLLVSQRQDVYLARVSDVRMRRGPVQAAFGSGNVRVVAGPELTLVLHDVPSARLVADLLGELTEHPTPLAQQHRGSL